MTKYFATAVCLLKIVVHTNKVSEVRQIFFSGTLDGNPFFLFLLPSQGIYLQACEKFIRIPNRTTQEKNVASRSDCHNGNRYFTEDSGAFLHMMSKNALTSGEKETTRTSKNLTVIMTANGTAGSTEEATVHDNNFNVLVTMMLLEDSLAVPFLGLLCEELVYSYEWKKESLHR